MKVVYVEPFDGGSHKRLTDRLTAAPFAEWTTLTWSAHHWKWRMRSAAVLAMLEHRAAFAGQDLVFASSFVPLAELVGLLPELQAIPRVLYFHENQLAYPSDGEPDVRDLHYGVTQMVSGLAATRCVFNSAYNRDSFLEQAERLLARMPKPRGRGWVAQLRERSEILPLPLELPREPVKLDPPTPAERQAGPIIGWNHRWEHDKNPELFFETLFALQAEGLPFRVIVLGERFAKAPPIFASAARRLGDRVLHIGYAPSRVDYLALLARCHIAVSTARHEFFGIAMLEATHLGAMPVVPNALAYPERFPAEFRYAGPADLRQRLATLIAAFVSGRSSLRASRRELTAAVQADVVLPRYRALFERLV